MALTYQSSVVFAGGPFPPSLLDERTLFAGEIDPQDHLVVGPIKQARYRSGKYRFALNPDRVDIVCTDDLDILPDALLETGATTAITLETVRSVVPVSGIGLNCEVVLDSESIGVSGIDFCRQLVNPRAFELVGADSLTSPMRFLFTRASVRYDIRLEPHVGTQGQNLWVAINGHQEVKPDELLRPKLDQADVIREYARALHSRIATVGA